MMMVISMHMWGVEIKNDIDAVKAMGAGMSQMRNALQLYAMIGMKFSYKNPQKRLKNIVANLESTMVQVKEKYQDQEIQDSIMRGLEAWIPLKKALSHLDISHPDSMKKNALYIHAHIRSVIKAMENIKTYLVSKSDFKDVKILNAAVEVAASSQRLSAHYMMKLWKLDDPTIQAHWNKGVSICDKSLKILSASSYASDPKFKKLVDKCGKDLEFCKIVFDQESGAAALFDKRANRTYKRANELVKMILSKTK